MKTKNNVQKTVLRSVAVVISFVLLSITVSAQGFWKKILVNSSFNEIALAMVKTTEKNNRSFSETSFNIIEDYEAQMELEAWMTNESNFDNTYFFYHYDADRNLEVEDWMLNKGLFETDVELEKSLELEDWMTSESAWNIR